MLRHILENTAAWLRRHYSLENVISHAAGIQQHAVLLYIFDCLLTPLRK